MTTEQDFHPDLYKLLQQVWDTSGEISSSNGIYDLYSGQQEGTATTVDRSKLEAFLDNLNKIQLFRFLDSQSKIKKGRVIVQGQGWPDLDAAWEKFNAEKLKTDTLWLWSTFYHFEGEWEGAYKRVYIHVANYADNVIEITTKLQSLISELKGLLKFKIAGPGGVDRKDQIIVYLSDEQSQTEVIESLRDLKDLFQPGVPMVVKQVEGLDGVGIADEPPDVSLEVEPRVESFGSYLSKVLYWALEESWYGEREQFLDAAEIALRVAGIDPKEPHLHARRMEIEELDRRGRIAQSRRKSLRAEAAAAEAEVSEVVYQAGMRAHLRAVRSRPAVDAATDPGSATDAATHPVI
jgi:hypothetical protein